MFKIFIDPGHGGKDPGACYKDIKEKDIVLDIGLMLGELLTKEGFKVDYSRTTDTFVSLYDRTNKSNKFGANVFISIHCNAHSNTQAHGVETFYYKTSSKGKSPESKIQKNIIDKKICTKDREIKEGNFYVLRKTKSVAVLLELDFITNQTDLAIMLRIKREFAKIAAESLKER